MNIAGQFPPYTPAIENNSSSGSLSMLQVRDFLGREWRLITMVTVLSVVLWGRLHRTFAVQVHRAGGHDHRHQAGDLDPVGDDG